MFDQQTYVPTAAEAPHACDYLSPTAYELVREAAIVAHAARIGTAVNTRGSPRAVICLTDVDDATGHLRRFESASEAGLWIGRCCDNVVQACRRHGRSGGHRWAYAAAMPDGFDEAAEVRLLLAPAA